MPNSFSNRIARHALLRFAALGCATLFLLGPSSIWAQSGGGVDSMGTGGIHSIQGRIYFPSGRRSDMRVMVKLQSYNSGELSVLSDANGGFAFKGLIPGSYTVVVDGGNDYETVRDSVYVETDGNTSRTGGIRLPPTPRIYTVQISLQPKRIDPLKTGVVSAALASVPDAAREWYEKAREAAQAGNSKQAIDDLNAALVIYPEFPLALNEIGVQYLRVGQADKAAAALGKAVKLAPEEFQPRLNYGIALLNQKRFAEAEDQLKVALAKNNSAPMAHMYLGIVLVNEHKLDGAQQELETAVRSNIVEVAKAHYYLGGIYWANRNYKRAADELDAYLKLAPKAPDAERLRQSIKDLRSKS